MHAFEGFKAFKDYGEVADVMSRSGRLLISCQKRGFENQNVSVREIAAVLDTSSMFNFGYILGLRRV